MLKTLDKCTIKKGFQYLVMTNDMHLFVAQISGGSSKLWSSKSFVPNSSIKFIMTLDKKFYDQCFLISEKPPTERTKVIGFRKSGRFDLFTITSQNRFYNVATGRCEKKSEILRWFNIPKLDVI